MTFNENLIRLRKAKGLSQEKLGNEINVARQTVSKWELGETTPEMNKLIELSKIFEISVDELIGNDGYTNTPQDAYYGKVRYEYEYTSKTKIKGIPLIHINIGFGFRRAKGIIAIGNIAQGILAIGAISMGVISIGGLGIGIFTLAGLALGLLFALGGIAFGAFALGGLAVGIYAIGGTAFAKHIAFGGYASGHIAIGEQVKGTITFIREHGIRTFDSVDVKNAILKEFPNTWRIIVSIFSSL